MITINGMGQRTAEWIAGIMSATTIVIAVMSIAIMLIGGAWIAPQKGRSKWEGAILAFFFGPFGLVVEALLPSWPGQKYRVRGHVEVQPEYHPPEDGHEKSEEHDDVEDWLQS